MPVSLAPKPEPVIVTVLLGTAFGGLMAMLDVTVTVTGGTVVEVEPVAPIE